MSLKCFIFSFHSNIDMSITYQTTEPARNKKKWPQRTRHKRMKAVAASEVRGSSIHIFVLSYFMAFANMDQHFICSHLLHAVARDGSLEFAPVCDKSRSLEYSTPTCVSQYAHQPSIRHLTPVCIIGIGSLNFLSPRLDFRRSVPTPRLTFGILIGCFCMAISSIERSFNE